MEGRIRFSAQPTPSYDEFETVTISASVTQVGGRGSVQLYADATLEEARTLAAELERACQLVERDS